MVIRIKEVKNGMDTESKDREGRAEKYWVRVEVSIGVEGEVEPYAHLEYVGDEVLVTELKGLGEHVSEGPGDYVYPSFREIVGRVGFMEGIGGRLMARGEEIERWLKGEDVPRGTKSNKEE
jgi:hypothetical protein